jgi:hypothetical protein
VKRNSREYLHNHGISVDVAAKTKEKDCINDDFLNAREVIALGQSDNDKHQAYTEQYQQYFKDSKVVLVGCLMLLYRTSPRLYQLLIRVRHAIPNTST